MIDIPKIHGFAHRLKAEVADFVDCTDPTTKDADGNPIKPIESYIHTQLKRIHDITGEALEEIGAS